MNDKQTQVYEDDLNEEEEEEEEEDEEDEEEEEELDEKDREDLLHFIADYVEEFAIEMSSPDFWENVRFALPCPGFDVDEYFQFGLVPRRSRPTCDDDGCIVSPDHLAALQNQPQAEQRSDEWFLFRHNVITASSIGKLFASDAQRNSVIYEKCNQVMPHNVVNFESPLHWGQKYEPLSVLVYQDLYGTEVGAFGCIPHPTCACIAASPDGINLGPRRHGRMLEIKNIVNRDITGVPLEAYWIQMQIQMEVCDLDACDFFETRFCEFPSEADFWDADNYKYIGIMLHFLSATTPEYRYEIMPLSTPKNESSAWIRQTQDAMRANHKLALFRTIYWYLDEYSCVLVERNRTWFNAAKPVIEATWATIVKERVEGYDHRAPKSRSVK
jgi:putative phage-type endonuclease